VVLNIVNDENENHLLLKIKDYHKKIKNNKNKAGAKSKNLYFPFLVPENTNCFIILENTGFHDFYKSKNVLTRPKQIHIPPPDLVLA
jgi:hypothetical protein